MGIFCLWLPLLLDPQPFSVQKIVFIDNHSIKTKTLRRLIHSKEKAPYDSLKVIGDINNLILFYKQEGFRATEIKDSLKLDSLNNRLDLIFKVSEGRRVRIYKITLSENPPLNIDLKKGDYLVERRVEETEKRIIRFYRNNGYPYIRVKREIREEGDSALVKFNINKGPLIYIIDMRIEGNKRVKSNPLKKITGIRIGEKFSEKRIFKAQQRLYATRLFSYVGFHISRFKDKRNGIILVFEVKELSPRVLGLGIGYETPDRFLLSLQWEHLNLFSSAHTISFTANISPSISGEYLFEFNTLYTIPNIYGLYANLSLHPFFNSEKKRSYLENTWGIEGGINKEVFRQFQLSLLNRYKRVSITPYDSLPIDRKGITNSIILNSLYDTRNEFFSPTKGIYLNLLLERAGGFLKGDNDFHRIILEPRIFLSLFKIIIAIRIRQGFIFPYGRIVHIPYYECFTLGGRNSLRGYPEKSVGDVIVGDERYGTFLFNNNFEIRFPIYKNLRGVIFFDGGNLVSELRNLYQDYEYSIGMGLRFNTVIGPLRLDYGKRLKNPEPSDKGRLYFGLFESF